MPSETIWSHPSNQPSLNSSAVADSDAPVSSGRRFTFTDSGEIESTLFDFKKSDFHNYPASIAAPPAAPHAQPVKNPPLQLGTASISGGIASRHPPQDSFLSKFSSVAEATRDIELSNGLGSLSLDGSRRTSFNADHSIKPFISSPPGSLNENLNMPPARSSRHQSISEKIDNYNNSSPIQATAALSISSDLNPTLGLQPLQQDQQRVGLHAPHTFWSPAASASFTPASTHNYFLENTPMPPHNHPPFQNNPYARSAMPPMPPVPPISPPPFMMANHPQFMDAAGMYGLMGYPSPAPPAESDKDDPQSHIPTSSSSTPALADDKKKSSSTNDDSSASSSSKSLSNNGRSGALPGIGLMNRQMHPGYMFSPFNPYAMYQQSPPPGSPPPQVPLDPHVPIIPPTILPTSFEPTLAPTPQFPPDSSRLHSGPSGTSGGGKKGKFGKGAAKSGSGSGRGGGNHIHRSPLLEEVRSNARGKDYHLKDIYGHAVEFTKDQHGSRFIQQKLPDASKEEKDTVFNEIRDLSYDLMTDVFGNYVIQKFFEHGSEPQKMVLLECMKSNIYELSLQMYGCRVVQRALEAVSLDGQKQVVEELRDHVLVCAKDQNGNHVIQKAIEKVPFENVRFILDSLNNHIYLLSTHPYGCRVIQRLLEYSEIEDQKKIMLDLNKYIYNLIQDQYGNYVIQHILERGNDEDRERIVQVALGSIVSFSKHKFASNVVERCIKHGNLEQDRRILKEVMMGNEDLEKETVDDDSPLALMMKDQYANYVIQKLVEVFDAKSTEKKNLVIKLRQYLKQISMRNNYGKHLASVEKMIIVAETALNEANRN